MHHGETGNQQTAAGFIKFLVDGAAPSPGPTDPSGFLTWSLYAEGFDEHSFAATATVTNTSLNQAHTVEADLGCEDILNGGCSEYIDLANLSIEAYKP